MKGDIEERTIAEANFIIENHATVRLAARNFQVSKSAIHKDLTERLPKFNLPLYKEVRRVLDTNLAERTSRGGQATKVKHQLGFKQFFTRRLVNGVA